ncbi:PHD finger protein [Panicum miliaceum]|uniref:PHD finger protein n=1 Tax=Panicum miliaceum TaxID=4540 RepID=A0A3L6RX11_PANMI|nr:PHD finger protein [Panicum miliaceum]
MGDAAAAAAPAASPAGKRRRGDEVAGLRRVAEIVMVLAAAGEVRGGREPTAAERALAAEAREKLAAAVAEGAVRPKDLFPGEAVRAVVEDLGLNRAKDPAAMGFRPPKASIADRLMLTKRKIQMEEVKEAPVQPTVSTPQTVVSGMSEFHSLNGASKFGVGVPRNPQVAAVATAASLTSTSPVILKPPGSSPVKPVANSSGVALPHIGPSHLQLEKDVNGPLNLARSEGIAQTSSIRCYLFICQLLRVDWGGIEDDDEDYEELAAEGSNGSPAAAAAEGVTPQLSQDGSSPPALVRFEAPARLKSVVCRPPQLSTNPSSSWRAGAAAPSSRRGLSPKWVSVKSKAERRGRAITFLSSAVTRSPRGEPTGVNGARPAFAYKEWLVGRCFWCLASDHKIAQCRDPPKCFECRRSRHLARWCPDRKRDRRRPISKALRSRLTFPPTNIHSRITFPPLPSSSTVAAASVPLRRAGDMEYVAGRPHQRSERSRTVVVATPDITRETDRLLAHAVVLTMPPDGYQPCAAEVAHALSQQLRVPRWNIKVSKHLPENFLADFNLAPQRDRAVRKGYIEIGGTILNIQPWAAAVQAATQPWWFHVRLTIERLPTELWSEAGFNLFLENVCVFDRMVGRTFRKEGTGMFSFWAWMWNPDDLPRSREFTFFPQGSGQVPAADSQGARRVAPPPVGRDIELLIHLDEYEDWRPHRARTAGFGASGLPPSSAADLEDAGPVIVPFRWTPGVLDGRSPNSYRDAVGRQAGVAMARRPSCGEIGTQMMSAQSRDVARSCRVGPAASAHRPELTAARATTRARRRSTADIRRCGLLEKSAGHMLHELTASPSWLSAPLSFSPDGDLDAHAGCRSPEYVPTSALRRGPIILGRDQDEEITFSPGVQLGAGSNEDAMQVIEQQVHEMDIDPAEPAGEASKGQDTVVHPNKSTLDTSARPNVNAVQSYNQLLKNKDTKLVAVQAATGNPIVGHRATQGVAFVPPKPTFVNHNEIAKSVQQFLNQPTNHPSWTPPSTEYMHSRLGCQICKVAITDTDSLLVCDACERGVHLKCLQQYGNKGVPKAEWHCSACLTQSKGKPLPPKYGKVTRTVVASKAAPPGGGAQASLQGSAENMAAKENHQKLAANGNLMKPISTQGGSTIHNINVLALGAMVAGSQSQLASTLRSPIVNTVKAETSSNGKEGTGQQGSSMPQPDVKSPLNKRLRSGSSLNSAGSANDTMNSDQTAEMSGAEAKIKSEANIEPPVSRDEELVDSSGTSVERTKIVATEEKPRAQATSETDKLKDEETATNTGTSTDQGRNFSTEEKLPSEATSEAPTINDVKMTIDTGIPVQQSNIVNIEEKLQIDAASDPHRIQDMEMSTNNGPPADQSSNIVAEEMSRYNSKEIDLDDSAANLEHVDSWIQVAKHLKLLGLPNAELDGGIMDGMAIGFCAPQDETLKARGGKHFEHVGNGHPEDHALEVAIADANIGWHALAVNECKDLQTWRQRP